MDIFNRHAQGGKTYAAKSAALTVIMGLEPGFPALKSGSLRLRARPPNKDYYPNVENRQTEKNETKKLGDPSLQKNACTRVSYV